MSIWLRLRRRRACEAVRAALDDGSLASLPVGGTARIRRVRVPDDRADDRGLVLRLLELGFVEGERVEVIARGPWGGEPLAARVGRRVFALRRDEALHVELQIDAAHA